MPYVIRDKESNKVVNISSLATSAFVEFLNDDDPEMVEYFSVALSSFNFNNDTIDYKIRRKLEYPKISDQLDLIMKTFKYLKANGVNIGPDGDLLLDSCQLIKDKIPKDWKPE
jgi:hypothetical protein